MYSKQLIEKISGNSWKWSMKIQQGYFVGDCNVMNDVNMIFYLAAAHCHLNILFNSNIQQTMNPQPPTTKTSIIEYILAPHQYPGNQLLETIKSHPQYHQICNNILYALSQSDQGLPTANTDYISMKLCEVSLSNHSKSQKLNKGIQILEEMEMKLDCLIQELQDRKQWVSKKADILHKNKQEAKQDCEILAHQNTKLQAQIEEKQNNDNGNSTANRNKIVGADQRRELEVLLKKYRCGTSGFPKNKNQAVRLLNSLEVRLQSLQVQKLGLS